MPHLDHPGCMGLLRPARRLRQGITRSGHIPGDRPSARRSARHSGTLPLLLEWEGKRADSTCHVTGIVSFVSIASRRDASARGGAGGHGHLVDGEGGEVGAIAVALRERLECERHRRGVEARLRRIRVTAERCARFLAPRPSAVQHGEVLYGERGLPK